ncbi:urease accessory protein UreD [Mixta tenebrionis]|uniref:Urease accessory protein UreD n=1 Tax=Mixta tenebrionis TaxID=2562439 RepID=A0A506V675_9GAMM|nr:MULTISPECIES: urease accessory protein UreD [Mixta]QHM76445.1 Urease accessory protein UreH [Mixta theicola]TPW41404.1 urease accessory protein [Mixta tenebrionis]
MRRGMALREIAHIGREAPELAAYQQEPPQMASGSPGKCGYLRLDFARRSRRSVLAHMERRAPSLVQRALYWDEAMPHMPCVFMISTSGCLLQGDRQALDIYMAAGACGHVTTQAATKIHAMSHNYAAQCQHITLEEESYLELMPDPVIPHDNSRFFSTTQIAIHPTATLLYGEIVTSGRKYHAADGGFNFDLYSSSVTASTSDGAELFSERYLLTPKTQPLNNVGVMGEFSVFGNLVLLTPARHHAAILQQSQPIYDAAAGIASGASLLPNQCGVIFKALGYEAHQVKSAMRAFWQVARQEITGASLMPAFLWR